MHPLPSHAHGLPLPPPRVVLTDPPLPWRPATRSHDAPLLTPVERPPQRWVWHGRFGTIVIEVRGSDVFVNGDRVEPHAP